MASTKQHTLFYGSSYDRGLQYLLFMWPEIREKYPDAELHICYGWELFEKAYRTNPERMKWKANMERMMRQPGIVHHGRIGGEKLREVRGKCGIWAYPTDFTEINCITALEAQQDGLVPVTMNYAALKETVGSGVRIEGGIRDYQVQEAYKNALIEMMGDKKRWQEESKKAKRFAKKYKWHTIAGKWNDVFTEEEHEPLVSVITVTKREGWWRVMAQALSEQTYQNFEWIIVDDHPKDRAGIAIEYAKRYNLNIVYIRGHKATGDYKRKHGLVRANNQGWKAAKGELLIYLQDFVIPPKHGIEDLVRLYRHHPNALLAPIDDFWHCKTPNMKNKFDWWTDEKEIFTTHSWRNVRRTFEGIRETDNPYDFEMDYAAIPKHIADHLNGWWEFFDDGMGFDNTEFAYRAMKAGYKVIVDDTNIARCVDLDPYIPHTDGSGNRQRYDQIQDLDPVRDPKKDK